MPRVPRPIKDFSSILHAAGFQCWLVGGSVRDMFRGEPPGDFDVATDARPEDVMGLFRSVIPTGIKHGTVTVRFQGMSVETSTFRTEADYSDGRHPDRVDFSKDIRQDLSRRDFTMNALALNCRSGELLDLFGGAEDIRGGIVRAVGDPLERFDEDGLRPLRAIRFASVLGFAIEAGTKAAIGKSIARASMVSSERVRDELSKIIEGPDPLGGLDLLAETGLLELFLPELDRLRGIAQAPPHAFDALGHSFRACAGAPARLDLRWAALLHDAGKALTRTEDADGVTRFIGHERASSEIAARVLNRLKYPKSFIDSVCLLIAHHMTRYDEGWTDAAVRRFISRIGEENLDGLLELLAADEYGLTGVQKNHGRMDGFRERISAIMEKGRAFGLKDLAVKGDDLLASGIPAGPSMGAVLKELLEAVLDDPSLNERETLLRIAEKIRERDGL